MSPGEIPETDTTRPQSVRRPWLGGEEAGDAIAAVFPEIEQIAVELRAFLGRAVRYLARKEGVRQFLDLYAGLPVADDIHQVAHRAASQGRAVYVGKDLLTPTCAPLADSGTGRLDAPEPTSIGSCPRPRARWTSAARSRLCCLRCCPTSPTTKRRTPPFAG